MRWCVSIGAVLVAGALAGGDVASIAAPNPGHQLAQTRNNASTVDVELILAVDVSYSMDMDELAIQREGYAQAIVSKEFLQALKSLPNGRSQSSLLRMGDVERLKIIIQPAADRGPEVADAADLLKIRRRRRSTAPRRPRSRARSISR